MSVEDSSSSNIESRLLEEEEALISAERIMENNERAVLLSKAQTIAWLLSHVFVILGIVLVSWWVRLLGGLSKVFNYHPLLMVIGFGFMTTASLSFRYPRVGLVRATRKWYHAINWSLALLMGILALVAVFASHNNKRIGLIANLYSFHSWVAILVVVGYLSQWIIALYAFVGSSTSSSSSSPSSSSSSSSSWKSSVLWVHQHAGPILYQAVGVTMLLGIQEKEGFVNCSYRVSEIDYYPKLDQIPVSCRVSHSLGLVVVLMTLTTAFAIHDFASVTNSTSRPILTQHIL